MTNKQVIIGFVLFMMIPTIGAIDDPSAATIGVWFIFFAMLAIVAVLARDNAKAGEQSLDHDATSPSSPSPQ